MPRSRYSFFKEEYPYFCTSSVVKFLPLLTQQVNTEIILNSLEFLQKKRSITLYAYVIMKNHIHFVVRGEKLSKKLGAFKSYTARCIIDRLIKNDESHYLDILRSQKSPSRTDRDHRLWQEGLHPKRIHNDNMMVQKIEYIHFNPVEAGYVDEPEEWNYSSAQNYQNGEAILDVTLFDGFGRYRH